MNNVQNKDQTGQRAVKTRVKNPTPRQAPTTSASKNDNTRKNEQVKKLTDDITQLKNLIMNKLVQKSQL
jgi:hypothetical protein